MDEDFVCDVFDTVYGLMLPEFAVPGVEDLFGKGKPCLTIYTEVNKAYLRVCERLGIGPEFGFPPEDHDLNEILNGMDDICRVVGYAMFRYGMEYQKGIPPTGEPPALQNSKKTSG